jgi:hypothetical protein
VRLKADSCFVAVLANPYPAAPVRVAGVNLARNLLAKDGKCSRSASADKLIPDPMGSVFSLAVRSFSVFHVQAPYGVNEKAFVRESEKA